MSWRLFSLALLLGACDLPRLPADEVCKDVGFAIANRVFACTGDEALADQRFREFIDEYSCRVPENFGAEIADYYRCPGAIRAVDCAEIEALGDDLDPLLEPRPFCANILEHVDGEPVGSGGDLNPDSGISFEDAGADAAEGGTP